MIKINMNFDRIGDYYLDLSALKSLDEGERDYIHGYYRDMLNYANDTNCLHIAESIFNTLIVAGYIKNRTQEEREKKLDYICG
jgi:hypothetical protein